jgi:hypothetical protein
MNIKIKKLKKIYDTVCKSQEKPLIGHKKQVKADVKGKTENKINAQRGGSEDLKKNREVCVLNCSPFRKHE